MNKSLFVTFCELHKKEKTKLKVFLENGVMLEGVITNYDEDGLILDKCYINKSFIISISLKDK